MAEILTSCDDYHWLVSDAAREHLRCAAESPQPLHALAKSLRRELSAGRVHLILEQIELRRRAREKFSRADCMFFTRQGLEQATDEQIAAYKAERFAQAAAVADLCCGIGGDMLALARRCTVTAVDRDAAVLQLAEANAAAMGLAAVRFHIGDAAACDLSAVDAWHIDPDRRASGRRATRVDLFEPDAAAIDLMLARCGNAAIKLAPASCAPQHWAERAELEWIGSRGECRQQAAWFGKLAAAPATRSATIVDASDSPRTVSGPPELPIDFAARVGRYLYEPHAAVLAAHLSGVLAAEHRLQAMTECGGYLTSDDRIDDAALAAFEVCEVLPFDRRRLRSLLRVRRIGRLEIKKRGVDVDPNRLHRQLTAQGDEAGVLLLAGGRSAVQAILARRC